MVNTNVDDGPRAAARPVAGGQAEWSPRVMPPLGAELSVPQQLACAFRILDGAGFAENIAGHITVRDDASQNMWVNPWGLWWNEIAASDICLVSPAAEVLAGRWDVTPAIHIHTELHRRRQDAHVVVHNHPYYATVLAALGIVPEFVHQTASMFDGDLAFVDEYTGEVATADLGADLAEHLGDASAVMLANHGVIVTGTSIAEATYRAATLERQCRLTYDVLATRREYTRVQEALRKPMKASLLERGTEFFWNGAVRALLRTSPEVLD